MRLNYNACVEANIFSGRRHRSAPEPQRSNAVERIQWSTADEANFVLDMFHSAEDARCCFLSLAPGERRIAQLVLEGAYGFESCAAGGWLLIPGDASLPIYWVPRTPTLRGYDPKGRILSEEPAPLAAFRPTPAGAMIEIEVGDRSSLECVIWRFGDGRTGLAEDLRRPLALERQSTFMLSSHASMAGPAAVYDYLVHGKVYENRFDFRRKRRICSELEAYALYLALHGLEAASGSGIYGLIKQQIVCSVIARQAPDGGWHHGEWTDVMESHYRFHTAAMLLLAASLEEQPDKTVRAALEKAATCIASCADPTDIGLWFPHDSLERSAELMDQAHPRWIASREFGKAPTNKMILNTHLDTIVALRRYQIVTGDDRYERQIASALKASRTLLALRPAERLYRMLYRLVNLTLMPEAEAKTLALGARAVRRLTREYILPNLYRVKRRFPRMVMPGGLIERHLSRLHFGVNYHSVNVADLARVWRCFPDEELEGILRGAASAVTSTRLLPYWVEARQRQALGYWVEALYHLCTLRDDPACRAHLAEAIIAAIDAGLGLPPSLLGAHPEVVAASARIPCPSPIDSRMRIANLSRPGAREVLAVNPTAEPIELEFERHREREFTWTASDGSNVAPGGSTSAIPPRTWILGRSV